MPECPLINAPLEPEEEPILEKLSSIQERLEKLKRDRSTYVKSQDVIPLYDETVEQVEILNRIRKDKPVKQNRVDKVLRSCFQLISLAYMTIGKNDEAPAVYSAVSNIKRLVDHLFEAKFFSTKDLQSLFKSLASYRQTVERGKESYSPHLLTLLESRIEACEKGLNHLQSAIDPLTPELSPTWEKLVSILRSLVGCCLKPVFAQEEFNELEAKLKEIEKDLDVHVVLNDGRSPSEKYIEKMSQLCLNEENTPRSLKLVKDLLTRCLLWVEIIKERHGKIDEKFKGLCDELVTIRSQLEKLSLMHSWSCRHTDLYEFEAKLVAIDEARVDGKFVDSDGNPGDIFVQRTLLYLLRKGYALIYQLIILSEPVSEALLPIYNQLSTLKRCLVQVKKFGGVSSTRELYPYSMKLSSIDNMRVDGKFMVGDDIPDGQANVIELLEECYELLYELRDDVDGEQTQEREEAAPHVGVAA